MIEEGVWTLYAALDINSDVSKLLTTLYFSFAVPSLSQPSPHRQPLPHENLAKALFISTKPSCVNVISPEVQASSWHF